MKILGLPPKLRYTARTTVTTLACLIGHQRKDPSLCLKLGAPVTKAMGPV